MCGVAGVFTPSGGDGAALGRLARGMADTLAHRGPDDVGVWVDGAARVALAQRRLSILDLSATGRQPMSSASGRFAIVFNGEIYNHLELRRELGEPRAEAAGLSGDPPAWRGRSDTETLLAGFEAWGVEKALQKAIGMFAFALWDQQARTLMLARDRLGEKPMYYGWLGPSFVFGSELKAIRAHPAFDGVVDRGALALFLRYNYVPAPHCIYRGIRKLPAATILSVSAAAREPQLSRYWSAREVAEAGLAAPLALDDAEAAAALEGLLSEAVAGQMVADVPVGAFLSGGVDSSTVVALMQTRSTRPAKTFTIGFSERGYDEAACAAAVARHLRTDHTELYVTPADARAVIPRLPEIYDEPFADSSQIPTFLVAQLARAQVTVALSGDGGDELFGGYNRHVWAAALRRARRIPRPLRRAAGGAIASVAPATWTRLFRLGAGLAPKRYRFTEVGDKLHKLARVLGRQGPDAIYRDLMSSWSAPERVVRDGAEETAALDAGEWAWLTDFERQIMYLDLVTYLPDDILVKVDRAAMSVSLETRVPLLDPRVVEFAWRLPTSQTIRRGQGKWLLRQVLYRHVPRALVERAKMGFAIPLGAWLRGPLREWAEALLDERRLKADGYLEPGAIRRCWDDHLSGRRNRSDELWGVLMFQAWLAPREGR
jgi:asparagine synthase (glutamine-hydrolysing)